MTVGKLPRNQVFLALSAALASAACVALMALAIPSAHAADATLRSAAEAKGLYFRAALNTGHIGETQDASTAATQFDLATPDNEMKWDTTEPSRGSFNFGPGDQ